VTLLLLFGLAVTRTFLQMRMNFFVLLALFLSTAKIVFLISFSVNFTRFPSTSLVTLIPNFLALFLRLMGIIIIDLEI